MPEGEFLVIRPLKSLATDMLFYTMQLSIQLYQSITRPFCFFGPGFITPLA